jgi:hypothetical protein
MDHPFGSTTPKEKFASPLLLVICGTMLPVLMPPMLRGAMLPASAQKGQLPGAHDS